MDRNHEQGASHAILHWSLSARRAWIEMSDDIGARLCEYVALRKESVDRNLS